MRRSRIGRLRAGIGDPSIRHRTAFTVVRPLVGGLIATGYTQRDKPQPMTDAVL